MLYRMAALAAFSLAFAVAGPRSTAATSGGTYLYVHDRGTVDRILGYALDREGGMTALPGSPFAGIGDTGGTCGGHCKSLSYSRRRRTLYAAAAEGVMAWSVGPDGALAAVEGAPFGDFLAYGTTVVEKGRRTFVYASDYAAGVVHGFEAGPDGALVEVEGSPFAALPGALGMAVGRGGVLCVYNQSADAISSFLVQADGRLVEADDSPFPEPVTGAWFVDTDPKGRYAYVASGDSVVATTVDRRTGNLAVIEGSPFGTGLSDLSGGIALGRRFGYVPGFEDAGDLQTVRVGRGGLLETVGGAVPVAFDAGDVGGHAVDPSGRIVVFADAGEAIQSFLVDRRTGIPAPADTENPSGTSINGVVIVKR